MQSILKGMGPLELKEINCDYDEAKKVTTLGPAMISNGEAIMKVAIAFTNEDGDNKVL